MSNPIKKAFNAAANHYDEHCNIQHTIGIKLIDLLLSLHSTSINVLDVGCGTGLVTQQLAQTISYTNFHAIDIADRSLLKAKARLNHLGIQIAEADFNRPLYYPFSFDFIFSNMALHWSTCFISTLNHITTLTHTNSLLAFTIPLTGTFKELQPQFACRHFFDPAFINEILSCCGYEVMINEREQFTLDFINTLTALRSIKKTGAHHVSTRQHQGLCGKSLIKQFPLQQLTYDIGYFIAIKKDAHAKQIIHRRNRYRRRQNIYQHRPIKSI